MRLITKPNCPFCTAFKKELDNLGIEYEAITKYNVFVPQFYDENGKLIFKGLPTKKKLHEYFSSRGAN